jgi:hypothetical protein
MLSFLPPPSLIYRRKKGENNLGYHAGNVLDKKGYACMMTTLIQAWRAAWSVEGGTTPADAPFGIVMLADSSDEGRWYIGLGIIG